MVLNLQKKKTVWFGDGKMATTATDNSTFSKWLYSHYIEFVTEIDKNHAVQNRSEDACPRVKGEGWWQGMS